MQEDMLNLITADVYKRFKEAIEVGRWPDGRKLTEKQLKLCMEAVLRFEKKHLPIDQHTGYMSNRCQKS